MLDITKLNDKLVSELRQIAQSLGIADTDTLRKQELISAIEEQNGHAQVPLSLSEATLPNTSSVMVTASQTNHSETKMDKGTEKGRKRTRSGKVSLDATRPHLEVPSVSLSDTHSNASNQASARQSSFNASKEVASSVQR